MFRGDWCLFTKIMDGSTWSLAYGWYALLSIREFLIPANFHFIYLGIHFISRLRSNSTHIDDTINHELITREWLSINSPVHNLRLMTSYAPLIVYHVYVRDHFYMKRIQNLECRVIICFILCSWISISVGVWIWRDKALSIIDNLYWYINSMLYLLYKKR